MKLFENHIFNPFRPESPNMLLYLSIRESICVLALVVTVTAGQKTPCFKCVCAVSYFGIEYNKKERTEKVSPYIL